MNNDKTPNELQQIMEERRNRSNARIVSLRKLYDNPANRDMNLSWWRDLLTGLVIVGSIAYGIIWLGMGWLL